MNQLTSTRVEMITPDYARSVLANQQPDTNRTLRKELVDRIATDITNGQWVVNGESIIFANDNITVLDGQHRLNAVVKANMPIASLVVRGVDPAAMSTIDTGAKRTNGDHIKMRLKVTDSTTVAASVAWIWRYRNGDMMGGSRTKAPSSQTVLQMLDEEPTIIDSRLIGRRCGKLIQPGLAAALHYLMALQDKTLADLFFDSLITGENLSMDSPTRVLRERLLKNALSRKKEPMPYLAFITIKAWNALRSGNTLRYFKIQDGEKFPMVK